MYKFTTEIEAHSYKKYMREVDKKIKSNEDFYEGVLVSYMVQDTETAKEIIKETTDDNLRDILAEFVLHCGSLAVDCGGRCGKLVAIELTHEDYYYVLSDKNGRWCESCVGKLKYIEEKCKDK